HIPADPFDGRSLRYLRSFPGYVVYSVGPDKEDHGGQKKEDASKIHNEEKQAYDITFTVDRSAGREEHGLAWKEPLVSTERNEENEGKITNLTATDHPPLSGRHRGIATVAALVKVLPSTIIGSKSCGTASSRPIKPPDFGERLTSWRVCQARSEKRADAS